MNQILPSRITDQPLSLPVYQFKNKILYLMDNHRIVVIVGQPGCGKTTQIPQILYDNGWALNENNEPRIIVCTQPRRLSAASIASRVAQERKVRLGGLVGYIVRFEECCSNETKIMYMTDELLFREAMMRDPLLSRYSVIMIDEAHERSIHTDLLLSILKKILKKRKDLGIIICSSTLDMKLFKEFFEGMDSEYLIKQPDIETEIQDQVAVLEMHEKRFPIDILYLTNSDEMNQSIHSNILLKRIYDTIIMIHLHEQPGDILVFLPGKEEIDQLLEYINSKQLEKNSECSKLLPMNLYANLSFDYQKRILDETPYGYRKVVISTNIAESSITIDGIVYVIDSGLVKVRVWDANLDIERLITIRCSRSSAIQRAGRAGRTQSGKIYRLYTEDIFNRMRNSAIPEIQRCNCTSLILHLKALGMNKIRQSDLISCPLTDIVESSLEFLYSLGALDDNANLTETIGTLMSQLPIDPISTKALITSHSLGCSDQTLSIVAMLSIEQSILASGRDSSDIQRHPFAVEEGDHITLLNIYNAFIRSEGSSFCQKYGFSLKSLQKAHLIRNHLIEYMKQFGMFPLKSNNSSVLIRKSFIPGYHKNLARANINSCVYYHFRHDIVSI